MELPTKAEQIAVEIASAHGLQHSPGVPTIWLDAAGLDARLRAIVASDYTPEEIVDEGRMLVRLGLLPAATSYEDIVFGLLGEQVVGLYDPMLHELVLVAGAQVPVETVLVHEMTHAIQDENFDLSLLLGRSPGCADEEAALHAVVEGDALLTEIVVSGLPLPEGLTPEIMLATIGEIEGSTSVGGTEMAKAPGVVRQSLLFPYVYGLPLMVLVYSRGGFGEVNSLLEDPPASTEQVMHPSKIGADDPRPVWLACPPSLSKTYRVAGTDVLGEFGLGSWLAGWIPEGAASSAVAGWGGDRYVFLWPRSVDAGEEHLDHGIMILLTEWDASPAPSPSAEAEEFASALRDYLAARYPGASSESGGMTIAGLPGGDWASVVRRDGRVLYVEGVPPSLAPAALVDEILGPSP